MNDEFNWGYTRPKADTVGKHTPGPWWVKTKNYLTIEGNRCFEIIGNRLQGTDPIASIVEFKGPELGIDEANANLIAAAPELLEALKEIFNEYDCTLTDLDKDYSAMKRARQAIAKAEGRIKL